MDTKLWERLLKCVVSGPEDGRLHEERFMSGYEVASQWQAVTRLQHYRALRDAAG